jgi:hypothetical protein
MRSRAVGEDTVAVAAAIWVAVSAAPVWAPGLEWDISATGLSDAVLRVGILIGVSGATLLSGPAGITDAATAIPIIARTAAICPPTELREHRQPSAAMSARSRPDFPSLSRLTTCPLCGGAKPRGLLECFGSYRRHDMRNSNPAIERSLAGLRSNINAMSYFDQARGFGAMAQNEPNIVTLGAETGTPR